MTNKVVHGIFVLVVLTVLLLLPTNVSAAKITINGEDMGQWVGGHYWYYDDWENKGKVLQTVVIDASGGYFRNNGNEAGGDNYDVGVNINNLTVNGGKVLNRGKYFWRVLFSSGTSQSGRIANVTVNDGYLQNGGIIDKARITGGSLLNTIENIDNVTLEGGGHFYGRIGEVTVEGGTLTNAATIQTATITDGTR